MKKKKTLILNNEEAYESTFCNTINPLLVTKMLNCSVNIIGKFDTYINSVST